MRRALLLLAVFGCERAQSTVDAKTDPAVCKANLEAAIDRACTLPSDCVLVESADCCGPVMLGVRAGTEATFPPIEATYVACLACPPLGCYHAPLAEDGTSASNGQMIVATCAANRCTSVVQ